MTQLTSEQQNNLINEYLNTNIPIVELCKKYHIPLNQFYNLKKQLNLSRKEPKIKKKPNYKINKNYEPKSKEEIKALVASTLQKHK